MHMMVFTTFSLQSTLYSCAALTLHHKRDCEYDHYHLRKTIPNDYDSMIDQLTYTMGTGNGMNAPPPPPGLSVLQRHYTPVIHVKTMGHMMEWRKERREGGRKGMGD